MSDSGNASNLEKIVSKAEAIGCIGSPSTTAHLTIDIFGTAVQRSLVGSMSIFKFMQNSHVHYGLGQITEVLLKNSLAEEQTMRGLTRQRGEIPQITGEQDTHTADMLTSAVFVDNSHGASPGSFGTVPSTGTKIRLINQEIVDQLFASFKDDISYVGKIMGTDVLLPSWFKHFGEGDGGLGDTRHIGIFGKTGSGKSYLAKMILASYMRHRAMTILVIDPQSEFTKMQNDTSIMNHITNVLNREIEFLNLSTMTFSVDNANYVTRGIAFRKFSKFLTTSRFLVDMLNIRADENQLQALSLINNIMERAVPRITVDQLHLRENFEQILDAMNTDENLARIYRGDAGQAGVRNELENGNRDMFFQTWVRIANLFGRPGAQSVNQVLGRIGETNPGRIIVVDLVDPNMAGGIPSDIKKQVINEILTNLIEIAEIKYNEQGLLNALVVIDEAHRFAPREHIDQRTDEATYLLKNTLKDAVRETRKYGLGWMLINQSIAGLDRELINQMGMYFFGYGLAYGAERQALMELIGGQESAARLYSQFKDPASTLPPRSYSFMSIGPSSPMSFSQAPLFFNALNYPDEYTRINLSSN